MIHEFFSELTSTNPLTYILLTIVFGALVGGVTMYLRDKKAAKTAEK